MLTKLKQKFLFASVATAVYAPAALAASSIQEGANKAAPTQTTDGRTTTSGPTDLVATFAVITNILLFLVGAVAVIALIYGGFLYVTSAGDAGRVKTAKDTIVYSVIGIVVAVLAYAIVNFVVGALD